MAAAVFGVRQLLEPAGLHAALRLTIEVLVGAVAYVASAFVVARPIAQDFLALATSILQRRRGAPASG
jgi:hypothetical protein